MVIHLHGGKTVNRTIESEKTLLIDGPASASVVSGKVEVFGSRLRNMRKIVVREGKRLPFAVKKTATFDISVGESTNVEEVDGDTIPSSWLQAFEELLNSQVKPSTAMVIGAVDSGKTGFSTFLINKLLNEGQKVAILDGDLGQSDIGPPCSVSYAFVTKPLTDLFGLQAKNAFFVGFTSPSRAVNKVLESLASSKQKIFSDNPDFVIVNTDGWVEGEDAVKYKFQLAEKLNPDIILCIQQKDELASLLEALQKFRKVSVDSPSAIRKRSTEKRRSLRELGYVRYLRNAKVRTIPLSWLKIEEGELIGLGRNYGNMAQVGKIYGLLGMKPLHLAELCDKICIVIGKRRWIDSENIRSVEEITKKKVVVVHKGEEKGLLMALYDDERNFLGIGSLREIDYIRNVMKIYTPVSEKISIVTVGRVKLDENLKETPIFPEENQSDLTFENLF
jgi:polynucleotide 5'-hydroxyl-kinase GRC3/NOL9